MTLLRNCYHKIIGSRFISIRDKFIWSVMGIIVVLAALNSLITSYYTMQMTHHDMENKGTLLRNILSQELTNMVLVRDMSRIDELINALKKNDADILYIVVINREKYVIGHTFPDNRIPSFILECSDKNEPVLFRDRIQKIYIRQFQAKIKDGMLGTVLIGMDESILRDKVKRLQTIFWAANCVFCLFSVLIIAVVADLILRPVKYLLQGFKNFVPGQTVSIEVIKGNDEMKLLYDGFTEMVMRLNVMDSAQRETQYKIIETEKLASIGVLASGVAHEINNPLAGIEACAYRLQKKFDVSSREKEYIELILESAHHLQTITRNLLQYARKPGEIEELIDLPVIIDFAVQLLHYRIEKECIDVAFDIPTYPCKVKGTKVSLIQVIINGLLNAIDASEAGSRIKISIRKKGNILTLSIVDNGTGIDPGVAGRVFDPFTTTKGSRGTGLGLYVSYNIVKAHDGSIQLIPNVGRGASLIIDLPCAASPDRFASQNNFEGEGMKTYEDTVG